MTTNSHVSKTQQTSWISDYVRGHLNGLLDVFHQPDKLSPYIYNKPEPSYPWTVLAVLLLIAYIISTSTVQTYELIRLSENTEYVFSQSDVDAQVPLFVFFSTALHLLLPLLNAVIALFACKMLPQHKHLNFKSALNIVLYTELIFALGLLIESIMIWITNDAQFSLRLSSIALYFGSGEQTSLFNTLHTIHLFTIGQFFAMVAIVIKAGSASKKVAYQVASIIVLGPPITFLLIKAML